MTDSERVCKAFHYVRQVQRSLSTLLQSLDPMLGDLGWVRYDWDHVWPLEIDRRMHASRPERWMPWAFFRSFHRPIRQEEEVLSVVAVPFLPNRPSFREAALLVSYMEVRDVPDEIYAVAAAQAFDRAAPMDALPRLVPQDPDPESWSPLLQEVWTRVARGRVWSVGLPLLEIRSSEQAMHLVRTLLSHPDLPGHGPTS